MTAKIWLGNLLVALAFGGLLAASNIGEADLDFPLNALAAAAAIIATTSVGMLGRHLAMTGRKQRAVQPRRLPPIHGRPSSTCEASQTMNCSRTQTSFAVSFS